MARILAVLPHTPTSSFQFSHAVIRSLYSAGHQITLICPFPTSIDMPNATIIDSKTEKTQVLKSKLNIFFGKNTSLWDSVEFSKKTGIQYCHDVLSLKEIQEILKSKVKSYDVLIIQLVYMYECFLPLAQKFDIPVIGLVPPRIWRLADRTVGNPFNPAVLRHEYSEYSQSWTFVDRLHNLYVTLQTDIFPSLFSPSSIERIHGQYYGLDFQLKQKISLLFMNNHALSFPATPLVPNAIDIGGIHITSPANSLPGMITEFLDNAKYGVIVFSLGGVVRGNSLTNEMKTTFKSVFSKIPQRIVWKIEEPLENLPSNVLVMKWIPQRDILAHRNVKAFITHCGVSGIYEAIYEAVPLILMPLYFDQSSNAAILEGFGVGVFIDLFSLTEEKMLSALNVVINDTKYAFNMQSLSQRFKYRPMSPQESVVYWTEYVIRHKNVTHLRSVGVDIPLYQYFMLDILAFLGIIVVGMYFSSIWLTNVFYRLIVVWVKTKIDTLN